MRRSNFEAPDRNENRENGKHRSYVTHLDAVGSDARPFTGRYTTESKYDDTKPTKKGFRPYSELDIDSTFGHPVDTVETLHLTKHLAGIVHRRNRDYWADHPLPNDGTTLYDVKVLEVAPEILQYEGIKLRGVPLQIPRVLVCFLQAARGLPDITNTHRYVTNAPRVHDTIADLTVGIDDWEPPSCRTLRRAEHQLPAALNAVGADMDAFENAATRARYWAFRNGLRLPGSDTND